MKTEHEQTAAKRELKAGSRLVLTLTDNDTGKVVLKEEHEVVEAPKQKQSDVKTRAGTVEPGIHTRLLSQEWFDPELEALNAQPEVETHERGAGVDDAAKIVAEAAKIGLDIGKFAWDVIKANKPVVDTTATTSSVLYRDTDGLDYQGAQKGASSSYSLSVRDSLIKSWELIHADILCEGTYHATPSREGIPDGYYLPAVNVYASKAHADFPCQLSAKAKLSGVSNMGRGKLDAMVTILSSLDFGWLFQRKHLTLKFSAQGSRGFYRS